MEMVTQVNRIGDRAEPNLVAIARALELLFRVCRICAAFRAIVHKRWFTADADSPGSRAISTCDIPASSPSISRQLRQSNCFRNSVRRRS